jgi:hypothetical protein
MRPGEMVLTVNHQRAIQGIAGSDVFNRIGVPDAPIRGVGGFPAYVNGSVNSGSNRRGGGGGDPGSTVIYIDLSMGNEDATKAFVKGASSEDGGAVIADVITKEKLNRVIR